jgi:hypothetical protein
VASEFTTEAEQSALCDKANQWLARFAPLVASNELPFESDTIRYQLSTVDALKQDAPDLQAQLQQLDGDSGRDLLATIQQATGQLGSIETDLRQQLAKIAPGDPQGIVDIVWPSDKPSKKLGLPTLTLYLERSMLRLHLRMSGPPSAWGSLDSRGRLLLWSIAS